MGPLLPALAGAPKKDEETDDEASADVEEVGFDDLSDDEFASRQEALETPADEAAEAPAEQDAEAASGAELHDPQSLATAAAASASEAAGYLSQIQDLADGASDDMADELGDAADAIQEAADEAQEASDEAQKAADDGDLEGAASAAATAAEACQRAGMALAAVHPDRAPPGAAPAADKAESAPTSGAPKSAMTTWMDNYAK